MDFTLSKEHEMARQLFKEFAENEVKPLAQEVDETETFPRETVEKMAKYGFMGIPVPKEYGGQGCDTLTYAMCVEELSKVCATTGVIVSAHTSLCIDPIMTFGTEEQKQKYVPDLASGRKIGAFGLTEPGAGTDAQGQQTKAVLDGDEWVINGSKCFITNGKEADVAVLDKLYQLNLNYFKELSMYILAGKKKLAQAKSVELPELLEKAQKSGLPEDTQAAKDFAAMCERFEKKIYDLELTRAISLQMAPQIRLIQSNDIAMSEKIQSTLVNTIPLWKSQMVIAIGLDHATDAAKAQRAVSDMTNELLKKNAEALKVASVETAKESERGIVDIETLKSTNQTLMTTLDEVMKIQEEGRARRQSAEEDLQRIENEMRDKLLEMSRASHT